MSVMVILNESVLAAPNRIEEASNVGRPAILIKKGDRHVSTDSIECLRIIQRKKKSLLMEVVENGNEILEDILVRNSSNRGMKCSFQPRFESFTLA